MGYSTGDGLYFCILFQFNYTAIIVARLDIGVISFINRRNYYVIITT